MKTRTPELDKMLSVKNESAIISDFIDFLNSNGYAICEYEDEDDRGYYQTSKTFEQLLAEHFGIDLQKCEKERQQILKEIRDNDKKDQSHQAKKKLASQRNI